jgi:hypothetical protein
MFALTTRRVIGIAACALLTGGAAAAVAAQSGQRQAEASAVVSLAPLTPEVSAYFLVPVAADFQAFMASHAATEAAAAGSDGVAGVFHTAHEQDASDVSVTYRGSSQATAKAGLSAGVAAAFDHVIASQVRRGTLATEAAARRVQAARSELVAFQRGQVGTDPTPAKRAELAVDEQILRSSLDQALKQQGDADRALSLVDGLSAALRRSPAVQQLDVVSVSPLPLLLRSAALGIVSGAVVVTALLWILGDPRGALGRGRASQRRWRTPRRAPEPPPSVPEEEEPVPTV